MPDDSVNIYIDFTASDIDPGSEDVSSELTFATADNIGAANIPTIFFAGAKSSGYRSINTEYTTTAITSGTEDASIGYFNPTSTTSGYLDKIIEYSTGLSLVSGTASIVSLYFIPDVLGSGYNDVRTGFISGQIFDGGSNISQEFWMPIVYSGSLDYEADYVSGFKFPLTNNIDTLFTKSTSSSGFRDALVDLSFAGYVFHDIPTDVFSTTATALSFPTEATVISGAVYGIAFDIYSTTSGIGGLYGDIYSSLVGLAGLAAEASTISGGIGFISQDIFSAAETLTAITCDIDLLSLKISNFSVGVGEWDYAEGQLYADVTDDVYSVTASGCYFKVNGVAVSSTTSGIVDGYRVFYDPADDFESLEGSSTITVHAENDNGDVLEQDFYLTFGYEVEFRNYERFGWYYGQGQRVVVRMSAENLANCPSSSADAYWFETRDIEGRDLTASVTGVYAWDGSSNLGASISPQSTAFFYGKVFRIKLTAKDYAGNEMEPLEFEFKIEDKPA